MLGIDPTRKYIVLLIVSYEYCLITQNDRKSQWIRLTD